MNLAIFLALAGGALGAWFGWRRGTRLLHRVSFLEDGPYGVGKREGRYRRRRRRLVLSLTWLVAGALLGVVMAVLLSR